MKDELIRSLRGEQVEFSGPAHQVTELEIVKFLYEKRERDELLAKLDNTLSAPLQHIATQLDEFVAGFYEPILSDPRVEGRMPNRSAGAAETLLARAGRDAFRDRENDLDLLLRWTLKVGQPEPVPKV